MYTYVAPIYTGLRLTSFPVQGKENGDFVSLSICLSYREHTDCILDISTDDGRYSAGFTALVWR